MVNANEKILSFYWVCVELITNVSFSDKGMKNE